MEAEWQPQSSSGAEPVLLVAAARSATTPLQYLLRSHPAFSAPTDESHFIIPLHKVAHAYEDLWAQGIVRKVIEQMRKISCEFVNEDLHDLDGNWESFAELLAARNEDTLHGLVRALFELTAEGEGRRRWVPTTPYYILHIPTVPTLYPDPQFVHIICDGRAQAIFMLKRARDLRLPIPHAAQVWAQYVDAGERSGELLGAKCNTEPRYAEVLATPDETLRRILDLLREAFDRKLLNFARPPTRAHRTPRLSQPLPRENSPKWRDQLTSWPIHTIEREASSAFSRNIRHFGIYC